MRKHIVLITNILIIVVVVAGFIAIEYGFISFYRQQTREQAQNAVVVTGVDVSSQISNVSTTQRVASQMIASDLFLKQWIRTETPNPDDNKDIQVLYDYLKEYKNVLGYDTVFFVSDETGNYYYQDGLNKIISPLDDFDSWYYNFVDLDEPYDIEIDRDETQEYAVNLFVNCRVEDENGNLLGVAGTAQEVGEIEEYITRMQDAMGVEIMIVNNGNAMNSFSGSTDHYKDVSEASKILGIPEMVLTSTDFGNDDYIWLDNIHCMTVKHNTDLNWNVIVVKDITQILNGYKKLVFYAILLLIAVLVVFITAATVLLTKMNRMSIEHENTDDLTGLFNNRIFRQKYTESLRKHRDNISLFMIDVDDFKKYNDQMGHLYGNGVLKLVSTLLLQTVGDSGIVGRWGGDEFIGIMYMNSQRTADLLRHLQKDLDDAETKMPVRISGGVTGVRHGDTIEAAIDRADVGLYESKNAGKGTVTVHDA